MYTHLYSNASQTIIRIRFLENILGGGVSRTSVRSMAYTLGFIFIQCLISYIMRHTVNPSLT